VAGAVVAVLVVAAGAVALTRMVGSGSSTTPAASSTSTPSSSSSPTTPAAPTATATPTKQYKTLPPKSLSLGTRWTAKVATSAGPLTLELYGDKAPQTVASFLFLSRDKYYDSTPCHRLTTAGIYVLQCGDPTGTGQGGPGYHYGIENAPKDGTYPAGTLAMARTTDINSNGSQFFMVYKDSSLPTDGGGYSIFGKVTSGLDVLKAIAAKGTANGTSDGPPKEPVTITSITVEKKQ
jgi:peptidyl-prolyl cis-trans isomerase B (cyclophilin B)